MLVLPLFIAFGTLPSAAAQAQTPQPLRAASTLGLQELERAVSAGAPALSAARREVAEAEADVRQARLLANPVLDAAWSTIPVARTNPSDLSRPLAHVPNYAVGMSYTFPLGKREPRRARATALADGARAELDYSQREQALGLAEVLGSVASAELRRAGIVELVDGGRRATELAEARLRAQFGTPLDVDQIKIEVARSEQLLQGVETELNGALADCASYVGTACESFASAADARAYLSRWVASGATVATSDPQARADLRALSAYTEAARADLRLAEAEKIPDPTLRFGYLRDQFVISGNQLNSLNVGVSVPLTVFDHGQAHRQAALATRSHLNEEHARRLAVARARIPALARRLSLAQSRCQQLTSEVIPQARNVLSDLEKAVENRLLPMMQVIQARRVVSELFIEEAGSCGDAYSASLSLIRETAAEGAVP